MEKDGKPNSGDFRVIAICKEGGKEILHVSIWEGGRGGGFYMYLYGKEFILQTDHQSKTSSSDCMQLKEV